VLTRPTVWYWTVNKQCENVFLNGRGRTNITTAVAIKTTYYNHGNYNNHVWNMAANVPVCLAKHPAGPRLVEVAKNYSDVLLFQLRHGRCHLIGKTLGFLHSKSHCIEISHESIVRLKHRHSNIIALATNSHLELKKRICLLLLKLLLEGVTVKLNYHHAFRCY
jgi:hypothetical protein